MPTLYNWYIDKPREHCHAHGNVVGHPKFTDSLPIHTSAIQRISLDGEIVTIETRNTVYMAALPDCDLARERNESRLFPEGLIERLKREYRARVYKTKKDSVLLVYSDHCSYYFDRCIVNRSGQKTELGMGTHLGMFQDSCLIGRAGMAVCESTCDIRYFPHPGWIEYYTMDTDSLPVYLRNAGEHTLYFRMGAYWLELPPGAGKKLCRHNALAKSRAAELSLPEGDLYPAL